MAEPSDLEFVSKWCALASALSMTTRTLERWRKAFPDEWPRLVDGQHSVAAWRQFALDRNLRPSYKWQPKALTTAAPALKPAADRAPVLSETSLPWLGDVAWDSRRDVLFELMDFLDGARLRGEIDAREFAKRALETLKLVCALAKVWNIPSEDFDGPGFTKSWIVSIAETLHKAGELRKKPAL